MPPQPQWPNVWVAVVSVLATAAVPAIVLAIKQLWPLFQQVRAKNRAEVAGEWKELYELLQAECARKQAEVEEFREELRSHRDTMQVLVTRHRLCELEQERARAWQQRASEWMSDARDAMAKANVHIRPWKPDPGPPPETEEP